MEKAGEIVIKILQNILKKNQSQSTSGLNQLIMGWDSLIDTRESGHFKIIDIVKDTLLVEVDHPAWLQMLKLKEKQLLKKINTRYPELQIKKLKFHLKKANSGENQEKKGSNAQNTGDNFRFELDKIMKTRDNDEN
ncbi:MAG: DUF721 domain-containing protein [Spirochaetales bacterium]|nr:DUF721 domain-containing protein [Spirochaetales bacterium]